MRLLRLGLDEQHRAHDDAVPGRLDLLDVHRQGVRDLLAQAQQRGLADELAGELLVGLVGRHAVREVAGALGEQRRQVVAQGVEAGALARR